MEFISAVQKTETGFQTVQCPEKVKSMLLFVELLILFFYFMQINNILAFSKC